VIISHSKKFCYWKIARTGSNTAEMCIRLSNVLDLEQDLVTYCHFFPHQHNIETHESGHTTPKEAVARGLLTQEQFCEYDHYTIVREPIARWISANAYRRRHDLTDRLTPQAYFDDFHDDLVSRRQTQYMFDGLQTYPFSDYENSIKAILKKIGWTLHDVPKIEHKTLKRSKRDAALAVWHTDLEQQLRDYYAGDFDLDY
jgi:hypothetical protein